MDIQTFPLAGPVLVTPRRFGDDRGWFCETWNKQALAEAGLNWPEFM